jgi:hypothetical protein
VLEYLTKFNELPSDVREKISTPEVMQIVSVLEEEYGINLATVVMRVMVQDLSIVDLPKFFVFEHKLEGTRAEELSDRLQNDVFSKVADYLGIPDNQDLKLEEVYANQDMDGGKDQIGRQNVNSSNFFFSSEDEEEVRELTKKLEDLPKHISVKPEDLADDIVKHLNVTFSSIDMSLRLRTVLATFIRGVRNRLDTRDTLIKEPVYGGLGLFENEVDQIMRSAEKAKQEFNNSEDVGQKTPLIKLPEDESALKVNHAGGKKTADFAIAGERDFAYDLKKMPKIQPSARVEAEKDKKDQPLDPLSLLAEEEKRIKEEKSAGKEQKTGGKAASDIILGDKPPLAVPVEIAGSKEEKILDLAGSNFKSRAQIPDSGKKKLEDVKHIPRVMGPIEEMLAMNLLDFRRFDKDPQRAAEKIKEKIQLLEEEKFTKKIEGILAWRQSPLIKMYIGIGMESINLHKPVNIIIDDLSAEGKEAMTFAEFNVIISLNKELRF